MMHRFRRWAPILLACLLAAGCAGTETDPEGRSVEALYVDARESLRNGNYSQAVERFEDLVARHPFGDHAVQAQLMIIYAHYRAGQYHSAVAAAERFERMHPRSEHVAYAIYMRGVARQSLGPGGLAGVFNVDETLRDPEPSRRAFADFRELVRDFPDSEYVDDAQARMERIREHLAAYERHVGAFYMEREAYIAAANRAYTVIARYPGTEAVPEAMEMLARAYEGLGLEPLSEQVERELRQRHEVPEPPLEPAAGGGLPGTP